MKDYQKYINALRKCAKEHENDGTFTGHIIVADLCRDTANLLEAIEQQSCEDEYIRVPKKALKYRTAGMVAYNAGWLKKHWQTELKVMGIECDDAISRQAAIDKIKEIYEWHDNVSKERIIEHFKRLPSAQPKYGVWVEIDDEPHEVWECDHCGFVIDGSGCIEPYEYRDTYKFCPNCGAKMVEPQESEEI